MRLIDADALEKRLDNEKWMDNFDRDFIVDVALDEAPTVDAVPVAHGHWKGEYLFGKLIQRCSVCETVFDGSVGFNYCGGCGAKMDGKDK